ncbi:hypothetical protein, partial [Bacillus thuringiensis]|uniref:hypothetical protein n=1 Tax=Bacillus thuringiensis TaxID=1428 RepID=UPI00299F80EF
VWRIQLKMYIFIQALMYIFKLAFIKHKRNTAIKNILPLYTPLLRGYIALLWNKKGIQQA